MTATIRRAAMRPALSPALRIPTVMAELQPRVRGLLESRLGRAHADTLIGVSNAVAHALTRGEAPLALDALQRVLQLAEIRGRQVVWQRREPELVADGDGLPARSHPPTPRPAPLPSGPVETCVDRTSLASLSGAGGLPAWTRDLEQSANALLATVPKAAAMGREAFAARLGDVLARDGVVPMDGTALRLLDRASAVLIDSRVLCAGRPRLLSVTTVGDLGEAEAWSAAQSVLNRRTLRELSGEGPWTRGPWRLERPSGLPAALPASPPALTADLRGEDGRRQARIRIGCELDPLADALVAAARSGARRLVLTSHASTDEIAPWADELLPLGVSLPDTVRRLQIGGHGVAVAETRPAASDTLTAEVAEIARELTLLGFIAIADTTRPGAAETVKRLTDAGVRVAMVTGDHPTTAVAIARELGIPDAEPVLTGAELDTLPEGERISRATVFARVSPEHKVRIVQALRQAGQVVAMTGDGVNDAAAIRLADIGIGLSAHGSASARAAADLVLTDPDPTRILDALREGRALWRSVRDAVAILVGGNAGEVAFTLLGAAVAGRAPLGARQLLLVNLLTDMLPALAVALARAREHKSGEDPLVGGPSSALFGSDLGRTLAVRGSATALGAAAAWQCGRMTGRARRASTMGLAALVGTQLGQTYLTDWHSPLVLITSVASAATLFAIVETPVVSHFFGCTPLGPMAWSIVGGCSAAATVGAALAPRLLFPRRVPLAV
ncbi:HAD-IC family P-type ATPase [Streptomyces asiaticus]